MPGATGSALLAFTLLLLYLITSTINALVSGATGGALLAFTLLLLYLITSTINALGPGATGGTPPRNKCGALRLNSALAAPY